MCLLPRSVVVMPPPLRLVRLAAVAVPTLGEGNTCSATALAVEEGRLAVGDDGGRVHVYAVEGGTARLETSARVPVLNDAEDEDEDEGSVTGVCFHPTRPNELYVACGTAVCVLDVDKPGMPALRVHAEVAEDEANCVCVDAKGRFFAVGDDAGRAMVFECGTSDDGGAAVRPKPRKVLRAAHNGICSCVAFAGARRPWDLITAGYDCRARLHDFSNGRLKAEVDMQAAAPQEGGREVCNPPFVHAVAALDNAAVVCRGDGRVALWSFHGDGGVSAWLGGACEAPGASRQAGHAAAATGAAVCHVGDADGLPPRTLVVTGGNDRRLILWDLSADAPWRMLAPVPVVAPVHVMRHGHKVNMVSACGALVAVADTSDSFSLYRIVEERAPPQP